MTYRIGKIDYEEVIRVKELGLPDSRIAERTGVTQSAVYQVRKKLKIKRDGNSGNGIIRNGNYLVNQFVWIRFLKKYKLDFGQNEITTEITT